MSRKTTKMLHPRAEIEKINYELAKVHVDIHDAIEAGDEEGRREAFARGEMLEARKKAFVDKLCQTQTSASKHREV